MNFSIIRQRPLRTEGTAPEAPLAPARFPVLPIIAAALFILIRAGAQQVTFSTLAGAPDGGSADGHSVDAQFNHPAKVAVDAAGNVYVADTWNDTIRKVTPEGIVSTVAGLAGTPGTRDGLASNARFNQPGGIAVDAFGNLFVADSGNQTIRKITPDGMVSTLAGKAGVSGSVDDVGTNAQFFLPQGVAVDLASNVYVADYGNHTIRKISADGSVHTIAGTAGAFGTTDANGSAARFYQPQGVAVDSGGNVYVADTANATIRKITPAGVVTTLAGSALHTGAMDATGANALFYQPESVAVDAAGNIYVADFFNNTIRKITPARVVSTLAGSAGKPGSADGTNSAARFWGPEGIAVDNGGQLYVADSGNSTIRKVGIQGSTATVRTLAGLASAGAVDGTGNEARFASPGGVAVAGGIYIADTANATIRKVTTSGEANVVAGLPGLFGAADGATNIARFFGPQGIAADGAGNLYVADTANSVIREITAGGTVSTLAGSAGSSGFVDGTNSSAQFFQPKGLAVDGSGNVFVADTGNHTIREINSAGVVTTIAGSPGIFGTADGTNGLARFHFPFGMALDAAGNLFVSDSLNHAIRKISHLGTNWVTTTVAGLPGSWGSSDGTNTSARFYRPEDITSDGLGSFYVTDSGNQTIRKLAPAGTNYVVTTIAGLAGIGGAANGAGAAPRFNFPAGIAVSSGGTIYVADSANNTLRLAAPGSGGAPVIVGQPLGQTVDPGGTATFSVMAAGSPSLSYQWRFNGVNLPGATGSTYIKVNAQALDAGNYSVVVTNSNGAATSADAALAVTAPPYIIIPPADQSAQLGQSVTFYVLAGGTQPLSYQWRFLGQDIPGARGPELHIGALVGTNAGEYSVLVANSAGSVLSGTATLSIEPLSTYGDNSFSQLEAPGSLLTQPIAVAAGAWHDLALTAAGKVIAWGANSSGQCDVPESLTNALAIAAGGYHSMAIRADRTVIAWGNNDYGQAAVPARLTNVLAVACGSWHSLALLGNGNVIAWGDNSEGQTNVPAGLSNVVAIAAGGNHSLALKRNGTVVGWGENIGENGTFTGQSIPPAGLTNVIRIAAGEFHSLAVTASGSAVAWGDDSEGQCAVPPGLTNIVAVAGGGGHSLALDAQGNVHAWGADFNGQCDIPSELTDLVGISAGEANSLVLAATRLPDPRLFTPELNKAGFSLVIQTLNRKSYALEYATALRAPAWTAISTNSGNGALEQLTDPNPSGPARFYRLRQW